MIALDQLDDVAERTTRFASCIRTMREARR